MEAGREPAPSPICQEPHTFTNQELLFSPSSLCSVPYPRGISVILAEAGGVILDIGLGKEREEVRVRENERKRGHGEGEEKRRERRRDEEGQGEVFNIRVPLAPGRLDFTAVETCP